MTLTMVTMWLLLKVNKSYSDTFNLKRVGLEKVLEEVLEASGLSK